MSAPLMLRRIAPESLPLYQSMRALQAAGKRVAMRSTSPPRGYVALELKAGHRPVQAWADASWLLRQCLAGVDELAWRVIDTRYAVDLIRERSAALSLPAPPSGWSDVRVLDVVEDTQPARPLLCFDEAGRECAMFQDFPCGSVSEVPAESELLRQLPFAARFRIGTSRAPLASLSRIRDGDAILIASPCSELVVAGRTLCRFQYQYEDSKIMLNESVDEVEVEKPLHEWDDDAADASRFNVDTLPVTLEFVLHEEQMPLERLTSLHAGSVLTLNDNAAASVIIRVNGQRFAVGELIQVGEQLAVEIKSVRSPLPR
ncbi:hypothetical protein WJ60_06345 [Burkholderia ubonensis]|uniref:type III secretion system cytoplasmic ring protein SctQ n=1 Tax=Burkholderia ubonensis TaxID=101571 RepID=UPI00075A355A|nr:type III secretion system cytoplasmic ring protein SctQ [Burkholderia ubonensis]KVM73929.1 hypothetical protein WJ60_06345 [Burkholderia ubonensis]